MGVKKHNIPRAPVDRQHQSSPGVSGHCWWLLISSRWEKKGKKGCGQEGFEKLICKAFEAEIVPVILLSDNG